MTAGEKPEKIRAGKDKTEAGLKARQREGWTKAGQTTCLTILRLRGAGQDKSRIRAGQNKGSTRHGPDTGRSTHKLMNLDARQWPDKTRQGSDKRRPRQDKGRTTHNRILSGEEMGHTKGRISQRPDTSWRNQRPDKARPDTSRSDQGLDPLPDVARAGEGPDKTTAGQSKAGQ